MWFVLRAGPFVFCVFDAGRCDQVVPTLARIRLAVEAGDTIGRNICVSPMFVVLQSTSLQSTQWVTAVRGGRKFQLNQLDNPVDRYRIGFTFDLNTADLCVRDCRVSDFDCKFRRQYTCAVLFI